MYSLTALLVITSSYCYVRVLEAPASRWWLAYGLVAGLAMYAHFFAAFVLLAQLLSLVFLPRPVPWRAIGRAVLVAGLVAAPLALYALTKGRESLNWIPALNREQVRTFLQTLTGASRRASVVVVLVVGLAAVVVFYRAWTNQRERLWRVGFPLVWFVVPIVATAVVSLAKPLFIDRYLIVVLPGFLLTIGVVLDSLAGWRRWLVPVAAAALIAVSYPGFDRVWGSGDGLEDWRQAVAYLDAHYEDGDEIVVGEDAFASTAYYSLRSPHLRGVRPVDPPRAWADPITRFRETPVVLAQRRAWIVVRAFNDLSHVEWETAARDDFRREAADNPRVRPVYRTKNVVIYRYDPVSL
jgi:mannosyltransferase